MTDPRGAPEVDDPKKEAMRPSFEAWYEKRYNWEAIRPAGSWQAEYLNDHANASWQAWQAAMAHKETKDLEHQAHCNLRFPATLGTKDDHCDCSASSLRDSKP